MLYLVYVIVMWNQTLFYLLMQMMIPLLLCSQQGEEPTIVCKQQFSYSTGVCVCYIQCAGYTSVYVVPGVCNSYVESNSVLLVDANDDTSSAVFPTRRGAYEKTCGIRNRQRNVYASLEVWMLWLGCLISITAVHGACV